MEIEAKFTVPDVETLRRLEAMNELAGFGLTPGKVKQVHDTFLDTVDRRIITSGHVCRRRLVDGEDRALQAIVGERDRSGVEGVRLDQLRAALRAHGANDVRRRFPPIDSGKFQEIEVRIGRDDCYPSRISARLRPSTATSVPASTTVPPRA